MDKIVWLVAGNKGGAGKSVVAKSLVEWLKHWQSITVVDGDTRTPDVTSVFKKRYRTEQFDLQEDAGWRLFSDTLCQSGIEGHVVVNLPDGISERAIGFFENFLALIDGYDFRVKVLFVMNTLPDGLHLFTQLAASFPDVIAVKNLHFGSAGTFTHFDETFGSEYGENTIHFPAMNPRIMQVARESNLSFSEFILQKDESENNFTYAKIVVADWFDSMQEAFDDALMNKDKDSAHE